MKIGIISDSHDRLDALELVLAILKDEEKIEALIHCGDLSAPFICPEYLDKLNVPVHVIFGNVEDRANTPKLAMTCKNVTHHGDVAEIELDGKKIAVNHYPDLAFALACTKKYDVVFHGHTHKQRIDDVDGVKLINPGEILGRFGTRSYAIYDTEKNTIEIKEFVA